MRTHYQILVIGGGQAGLSVAARLLRAEPGLEVGIVEPSQRHIYQPGLTLVGGGVFSLNDIIRDEGDYIPPGADWIEDGAESFEPGENRVTTASGMKLTYDYMVVCAGNQMDWGSVKGLKETIGRNGVCSNYHFELAPYTYECIKGFSGGRALFTQPASLIKCGAAPQKIMYLAADSFRRRGLSGKSEVAFYTGKPGLLRVKEINAALMRIADRYGIRRVFQSSLVEVRGESKEAVIEVAREEGTETVTLGFEMLHVAPPQSAPDFIKHSPLAVEGDPQGWVDVDAATFRHRRFANVFSLGDAASLGDTKTGAAVRLQAPILVRNLLDVMKQGGLEGLPGYAGYTACPITTAYGKLLLAEFDNDNALKPTFPLDPAKERRAYWMLMKHGVPWLYWNRILRGKS
jgi:sulfide:quinone oxidoreductase